MSMFNICRDGFNIRSIQFCRNIWLSFSEFLSRVSTLSQSEHSIKFFRNFRGKRRWLIIFSEKDRIYHSTVTKVQLRHGCFLRFPKFSEERKWEHFFSVCKRYFKCYVGRSLVIKLNKTVLAAERKIGKEQFEYLQFL